MLLLLILQFISLWAVTVSGARHRLSYEEISTTNTHNSNNNGNSNGNGINLIVDKKSSNSRTCSPHQKAALEDMIDFITNTHSIKELSPLRGIINEVRLFLAVTTGLQHGCRNCEVHVRTESIIGQCEVEDRKELGHCAIVLQRQNGGTLDIKCWLADSGHAFISLMQFFDNKAGFFYSLTTHQTCTKYFHLNNQ